MPAIALIGLDWGSTNVRAYAFAADGSVIARAHSHAGALTLAGDAAFDAALVALVGDWARGNPAAPLLACGMVGAKAGWREARYVSIGATAQGAVDAATLARHLTRVPTSLGRDLAIVPGLCSDEPDVMRGEETQLAGAQVSDGIVVLPGTHSKWVQMSAGGVASFATFYTGEMNALIRDQSSVGKAIAGAAPDLSDEAALSLGVHYARAGAASWLHDLFVLRAAVVTGQRSAAEVSTVLAGWLLGCEFTAALAMYPDCRDISLIASESLQPWYRATARLFDVQVNVIAGEAASTRGLWRVAASAWPAAA